MKIESISRRRFLKYAGATAAAVGVSALGLDYVLPPKPASPGLTNSLTSSLMSSYTSASTPTARTTDLQIELFHDYHGDGQQQSDEPSISDLILDIQGIGNDYMTTFQSESDGKYWARNIPIGNQYRVVPKTDRFRYVALSNAEFTSIMDYYYLVTSDEPTLRLGMMEGFLTLPFRSGTKIDHAIYMDLDPSDKFRDWRGSDGSDYRSFSCRETFNAHLGTDFFVPEGQPVVAAAPGTVTLAQYEKGKDLDPNIVIYHNKTFETIYVHMSDVSVRPTQKIERGKQIGLTGKANMPLCEPPHLHFQLNFPPYNTDPYRDLSNPRSVSYWTKDNAPQYPLE